MSPLARNLSGARGSPNSHLGIRNTAKMNGQSTTNFRNGECQYYYNRNENHFPGDGKPQKINHFNGNGKPYNNYRNYNNGNGNGNGNGKPYNNNNNHFNGNGKPYNNYRNYNNGNGKPYLDQNNYDNGNGNGIPNQNPNYKGKNFNPNYRGKNFNANYQGPRQGPVGDVCGNPQAQFNGQVSFTGPRNNRRGRNRNRNRNCNNQSLPDQFNHMLQDTDVIMTDDLPDEPNDIEMPDAPPLEVDSRIEALNNGARAMQEIVSHPALHFNSAPNPFKLRYCGQNFIPNHSTGGDHVPIGC